MPSESIGCLYFVAVCSLGGGGENREEQQAIDGVGDYW